MKEKKWNEIRKCRVTNNKLIVGNEKKLIKINQKEKPH